MIWALATVFDISFVVIELLFRLDFLFWHVVLLVGGRGGGKTNSCYYSVELLFPIVDLLP